MSKAKTDRSKDRDEADVSLENFGTRLIKFRKALKLTAPNFAEALGLNGPELLSRWENNELLPSTATLIRMAEKWGIDLNSLLVGMPLAAIATELKALHAIKSEFRQYRNVIQEHIKRLQTIDGVAESLLTKMEAAETEATKKRKSLEKRIL